MKLLILLLASTFSLAADQPGSKDHPLITRYPGSEIHFYATENYSSATIQTGPREGHSVEGKITRIAYNLPPERSILEVYRNYQNALRSKKFQTLYQVDGKAAGNGRSFLKQMNLDYRVCIAPIVSRPEHGFLSATLSKKVYISVYVTECTRSGVKTKRALIEITELKDMENDLIQVNADEMAKQIAETGHASVYGILFDTGSAVIKPASKPVLDEVGKLMSIRPTLRLYIVGHTDSQGELDSNMKLSRERATSVVSTLVTQFKIQPSRLKGFGLGPLSPKQSNQSDSGREQNRRVELVEM